MKKQPLLERRQLLRCYHPLNLNSNSSPEMAAIQRLTSLTKLDIGWSHVGIGGRDLVGYEIQSLTNLVELSLNGNHHIQNYDIQNLVNLTKLDIGGTRITYNGIRKLTNLTVLNLSNTFDFTYENLRRFPRLRGLINSKLSVIKF